MPLPQQSSEQHYTVPHQCHSIAIFYKQTRLDVQGHLPVHADTLPVTAKDPPGFEPCYQESRYKVLGEKTLKKKKPVESKIHRIN